jgi:hypothetical protein
LYCMNKRFEFWFDGYFKEFENTHLGFLVQRVLHAIGVHDRILSKFTRLESC